MIENPYNEAQRLNPGDSATNISRTRFAKRRIKGNVVLDSTWVHHLDVRRSGGMYRITRRELMERFKQLQQAPMGMVLSPSAMQGSCGLTVSKSPLDDMAALGHPHFVGFYETEAFLLNSVRAFVASGLVNGDATIVVATDAHRDLFGCALMAAGVDTHEARRCGRFVELDASEELAKFMVDGMPDVARFRATMGQLVSQMAERGRDVRIYGEMVAVLWDQGSVAAAIALEDLWNDLAARYSFSLFCAYPMHAFGAEASAEMFRRICGQHSKAILQGQKS